MYVATFRSHISRILNLALVRPLSLQLMAANLPENAALVCLDFETSGCSNKEVVQIGAVCEGAVFDRLVRPRLSMSQFPHTSRVHGLCDEDVRDSPSFGQVFVESFKPWLDKHIQPGRPIVLVGFNNWASDDKVLHWELARHNLKITIFERDVWSADLSEVVQAQKKRPDFCQVRFHCDGGVLCRCVPRHTNPKCSCCSLKNVYERHFGRPLEGAHGAVEDAAAVRELLPFYWQDLRMRPFGKEWKQKKDSRADIISARGVVAPIFAPVQEEVFSRISSNADAGVEIKGTPIEHCPLEVDLARTSASNSKETDLLQPSFPGGAEIEEVFGFSLPEQEPEERDDPRPSPKRQRLVGRHHERFIVSRPCFCGRPCTWYFDCQCSIALDAQGRLLAEMGIA